MFAFILKTHTKMAYATIYRTTPFFQKLEILPSDISTMVMERDKILSLIN